MASTTEVPRSANPRDDESGRLLDLSLPHGKAASRSKTFGRLVFGSGLIASLAAAFMFGVPFLASLASTDSTAKTLTSPVVRTKLLITVTEDGNVESASNIDIKCKTPGGSTILWIVPDGTTVAKGDVIVKLDESKIDDQLNTQKIAYEKALATKIQVEQDFLAAKISVQEYEEGIYVKDHQLVEGQIVIAEENLRSSENMLAHADRMARKGYVTPLQREAQEFAVKRAKLDLATAKTARTVLETFTKKKMLTDLQSKRDAAQAKVKSEEAAFKLEESRLHRLEDQLKNCLVIAPQAGMVVYANENGGGGRGGQQSVKIEEGAMVREQQNLIRLPDLGQMQVKVTVHESKVDRIQPGMPARIRIQDRDLPGTVISVANQPEPGSWFSSSVKEYATIVKIDGEASGLKPGMTSEVEILIAEFDNVLTVPVQAVVEKNNEFYCWVQTAHGREKRPLRIGDSNDKVIEVKDGVLEGDAVLLNPLALVSEAREEDKSATETGETKDKFRDQKRSGKSAGDGVTAKLGETKAAGPGADSAKEKPAGGPAGAIPKAAGGDATAAPAPAGEGAPADGSAPKGTGEKGARRGGGAGMAQLDKDGDGKISREEAPSRMQENFDKLDTNSDGFIDAAEMAAMRARFGGGGAGGPPRPEGENR